MARIREEKASDPDDVLLAAVIELSKDLELRPLLRRFVETAAELTHAQYGALAILSSEGTFDDIVIHGIDEEQAAAIGEGPHGRGVLGEIITHPQTLRVSNISAHPNSVGFPENHPPMTAFLGCPIMIRDVVYGNIYLANKRDAEQFSSRDERVLEALASAAGSAIAHARTLAESAARERWARAAADGQHILTHFTPTEAWPALVSRFDQILTANLVEHIAPHHARARLGEPATELELRPRATYLDAEQVAELTDTSMKSGLLVPILSDGEEVRFLLFAWDRAQISLAPGPLEEIGQMVSDRLTVAALIAQKQAETERIAILEDRDRIAQDLHDHVIQRLFAAGMRVQSILPRITDETSHDKLDAVVTDLDETIMDVRRAIFDLHQGGAALALAHSVEQLAAQATDALGFAPTISVIGDYWSLDDGVVADILAVIREALSNAARHAHAGAVRIVLDVNSGIHLKITDDGIGVPDDPERRSGLDHLAARAQRWGGNCEIRRRTHGGTAVLWNVPRKERNSPDARGSQTF